MPLAVWRGEKGQRLRRALSRHERMVIRACSDDNVTSSRLNQLNKTVRPHHFGRHNMGATIAIDTAFLSTRYTTDPCQWLGSFFALKFAAGFITRMYIIDLIPSQ
jgi:hypothetical protein